MRQALHSQVVPDMGRDIYGIGAGAAARPVGHTDVGRMERCDLIRSVQYTLVSRIRLGRKYLEGYMRGCLFQDLSDLHNLSSFISKEQSLRLCSFLWFTFRRKVSHTVWRNCSRRSLSPCPALRSCSSPSSCRNRSAPRTGRSPSSRGRCNC